MNLGGPFQVMQPLGVIGFVYVSLGFPTVTTSLLALSQGATPDRQLVAAVHSGDE